MTPLVCNSEAVLINPPGRALGTRNAIMSGRSVPYIVEKFPGPLSIKWMPSGWGTWQTRAGNYRVDASVYLVLNQGQEYSLTIDLDEPRETFCPFFGAGFVEHTQRSLATADTVQLDDPAAHTATGLHFAEQLVRCDDWVTPHLRRMHAGWREQGPEWLAAQFYQLAEGLVCAHADQRRRIANVPAMRAATRAEIARRLHRARDFMHAHFDEALSLTTIARVACLSPHHFHRLFRTVFGQHAARLFDPTSPGAGEDALAPYRAAGHRNLLRRRLSEPRVVLGLLPPRRWRLSQRLPRRGARKLARSKKPDPRGRATVAPMPTHDVPVTTIAGQRIGLLADTHCHRPDHGDLPTAVLDALRGVDLIIHLGDMGEAWVLDRLQEVAPVLATRGGDDPREDPRLAPGARVIEAGGLVAGALFDLAAAGIAQPKDGQLDVRRIAAPPQHPARNIWPARRHRHLRIHASRDARTSRRHPLRQSRKRNPPRTRHRPRYRRHPRSALPRRHGPLTANQQMTESQTS